MHVFIGNEFYCVYVLKKPVHKYAMSTMSIEVRKYSGNDYIPNTVDNLKLLLESNIYKTLDFKSKTFRLELDRLENFFFKEKKVGYDTALIIDNSVFIVRDKVFLSNGNGIVLNPFLKDLVGRIENVDLFSDFDLKSYFKNVYLVR